jgi:uncharacterized protein with HEPN domain
MLCCAWLTVVGEASVSLSAEFKAGHPEIPRPQIAGFRNRIVHDYFGFNPDTACRGVAGSLPELAARLTEILAVEFPQ